MKIKLESEIICTNPLKCNDEIVKAIKKKYPDLILEGENQNGHLSISHTQNTHIIWLFAYDKKGNAESEDTSSKETVIRKNSKVTKYTGTTIRKAVLKKLI